MPLNDAALEIPYPELRLHLRTDPFPVGGADLSIDAAIRDNLDTAIGEQQIEAAPARAGA